MIVAGGASGIGIETVKSLAGAGASVTIGARRVGAAEEVAEALRRKTGNEKIDVRPLDLSDLRSVRTFVANWTNRYTRSSTMRASWRCPSWSGHPKAVRSSLQQTFWGTSRSRSAFTPISRGPRVRALCP